MGAIADVSDLILKSTGGNDGNPETVFFYKAPRIDGAGSSIFTSGLPFSMWRYDGDPSGAAVPTTVANPTLATPGAIRFTNPGGGREKHLIQTWATATVAPGLLIVYDRLLHIGGFDATVTDPQTVGGTLTRNTSGVGNWAWAEIYTAVGATARTITMSYTNTTPASGRTSPAVQIGSTSYREAQRAMLFPLQSGDIGVTSVQSVTINTSTDAAGNFGVTIGRPLAYVGVGAAGAPGWRDFTTGMPGIPVIPTDACLSILWVPTVTTVVEINGGLQMVEA
jgi:hypothetical protein